MADEHKTRKQFSRDRVRNEKLKSEELLSKTLLLEKDWGKLKRNFLLSGIEI